MTNVNNFKTGDVVELVEGKYLMSFPEGKRFEVKVTDTEIMTHEMLTEGDSLIIEEGKLITKTFIILTEIDTQLHPDFPLSFSIDENEQGFKATGRNLKDEAQQRLLTLENELYEATLELNANIVEDESLLLSVSNIRKEIKEIEKKYNI